MRSKARHQFFAQLWPIIVAVLLVLSTITGFYTFPQWVYYGIIAVVSLQVVLFGRGLRKIQTLLVVFIVICALSLVVNRPPAYFNAWIRLLAFLVLISAVGPLFNSKKIGYFRLRLFDAIMLICVALSVGSVICYFLGINFFVRYDEILEIEAGRFSGLYNHSMTLGPMSGLASIYLLAEYSSRKKGRIVIILLLFACLASTFLSASRAALGSTALGMTAFFIRFYKGRFSTLIFGGIVVVGLLAMSFSLWGDITDFVVQKQAASISRGEGFLLTRQDMYLARIKEISAHPLLGVGFSCVDPIYSYVDTTTGKVEPGTSWLAVFSMTGLLGFLSFVILFIKSIIISRSEVKMKLSSLHIGCLAFFLLHLLFEGYVLAAGNMLALVFWLVLGCVWATAVDKKS